MKLEDHVRGVVSGGREPGQIRSAAFAAGADTVLLTVGVASGWFAAGALLIAAWVQTVALGIVTVAVVFVAAARAPDPPRTAGGWPEMGSGQRRPGKAAARFTAGFFTVHYGAFMFGLGVFTLVYGLTAGVGSLTLSGFVALMARTAVAVTPMGLADWRWVAEDEYAHLAEKTTALVGRAYLRMVPLHVGLVAVLGPQIGSTARRAGGSLILSLSIVVVVVAATFVGSWWRYPQMGTTADAGASLPSGPRPGATPPGGSLPPPPAPPPPVAPPPPPPPPVPRSA